MRRHPKTQSLAEPLEPLPVAALEPGTAVSSASCSSANAFGDV